MSSEQHDQRDVPAPEQLPFVAPCKILDTNAPFRWITLGWRDFKAAPKPSLIYGTVMLILSYLISFLALKFGNLYSLLALMSGFILLGPVIAIGLYSISCQLQEGKTPVLGYCLREGTKHIANIILFGFMAPMETYTASKPSLNRVSKFFISTPVSRLTPASSKRAEISSWRTSLGSLYLGIPQSMAPPHLLAFSKTVTSWPSIPR